MGDKAETLHIAMYPWFAMGYITPFLELSNKLADRGHKISFFIPSKTLHKLEHLNYHPDLITFIPLIVPHVEGLPPGAETTADVPSAMGTLIMTAMDLTRPIIEAHLQELKPHFVFYDFTHWLPSNTRPLGIKAIWFLVVSAAATGYFGNIITSNQGEILAESDFLEPPEGFPPSSIKVRAYEARDMVSFFAKEFGMNISFRKRLFIASSNSDATCFYTCRDIEGPYCEYIEKIFNKPCLLTGPILSEPTISTLEERWSKWLDKFKPRSVIFCAFGTESVLKKDQFQELVLGFELTGLPFLAALKLLGEDGSIESALPEGFEERNKGRGAVYGGCVQQQLILRHPSVGCFITHCGSGSLLQGLVSECQLVLLPNEAEQIIIARAMAGDLKVGVEIEKGEDGLFTKEVVCNTILSGMEVDSKSGKEVRENHAKLRELLLSKRLENSYIDELVKKLKDLLQE